MKAILIPLILGFGFVAVPYDGLLCASPVSKSQEGQAAAGKRKQQDQRLGGELERALTRVAEAQAEVDMCAARVAWSAWMVKKGCFPRIQVDAEQARLEVAKAVLMQALQELSTVKLGPANTRGD